MLNLRSYRDFVYVDCWVISMASSCICAQKNDAPNSAGVLEFVGTAAAHAGLPGLWRISVTDSDIAQIWQLAMVCHNFFGAYSEDWHQNIFNIDYWLYMIVLGISCNGVSLFSDFQWWPTSRQCEFFLVCKLLIFTCLVFRRSLFRKDAANSTRISHNPSWNEFLRIYSFQGLSGVPCHTFERMPKQQTSSTIQLLCRSMASLQKQLGWQILWFWDTLGSWTFAIIALISCHNWWPSPTLVVTVLTLSRKTMEHHWWIKIASGFVRQVEPSISRTWLVQHFKL